LTRQTHRDSIRMLAIAGQTSGPHRCSNTCTGLTQNME